MACLRQLRRVVGISIRFTDHFYDETSTLPLFKVSPTAHAEFFDNDETSVELGSGYARAVQQLSFSYVLLRKRLRSLRRRARRRLASARAGRLIVGPRR